MRLLVVTHYFDDHRGGVEIVAGELARGLTSRGHDVRWAASGERPAPVEQSVVRLEMAACNVSERRLGVPYPLWGPASLVRLTREVRRCDLLHLHDCLYMGNLFALLVARLCGKPVVVTQHIGLVPYSSPLLGRLMRVANRTLGRLALGAADQVLFCSEKAQAYFEDFVHFRRPSLFVANGVSRKFESLGEEQRRRLRASYGYGEEEPLILFVGRFVERKGLRFVHHLARKEPGCRFLLVGWGVEDPRSWQLENVEVLGSLPQDEVVSYYQMADLLVLPSVGEGFPLVIQEAMACGTPVLTSEDTARGFDAVRAVAGVSELDEQAFHDAFSALLLSADSLAAKRAEVARFARRHWSWDRTLARYEEIFADLSSSGSAV